MTDVLVSDVIALARLYADQRPGGASAFVPDTGTGVATTLTLFNLAAAEFYDLLVASRGHEYFSKDATISIVDGTSLYDLPADFYEALSLHLIWTANDNEPVHDISNAERLRYQNIATWGRWTPKAYRIKAAQQTTTGLVRKIEIFPIPRGSVTGTLRYVPTFTPLVTTDFVNTVNSWHKLIALRIASEMRMVAQEPADDLLALLTTERDRIEALANAQAANEPPTVTDVYPEAGMPQWLADRRWL